jgi:glycosyltransferase involved in cell wall biosynthesis
MITVGIFCYNEEKNIVNTIFAIKQSLRKANIMNYEILVINDGSTDGTLTEIEQTMDIDSRIKVKSNLQNLGIAESVKIIAKYSINEAILLVPGDNTYASEEYLKIIEEYQKNIIIKHLSVIGIREGKDPRGINRNLFSFMARQLLLLHDFSRIIIPNYILIFTTKKHIALVPHEISGYAQGIGLFGTILMVRSPIKYVKVRQLGESGARSKKVQGTDIFNVFKAHLLLFKFRKRIKKKYKSIS